MSEKKAKNIKDNKRSKDFGMKSMKSLIDGSLLTKSGVVKQLPFVLFLTLLAIVYIANRYNAEKRIREINSIQAEIKELKSEQLGIASELMFISKQSEVYKRIVENNMNLIEANEPPIIISKKN